MFFCVLLHKNVAFFLFFYILCKRPLRSLRSFMFLAKEHCVLCVLLHTKEKNAKELIVLLGLISRQKLEKERKRTLRSLKERKRTMRSERKRMWCPTLVLSVSA